MTAAAGGWSDAYIGLGANLGDKRAALESAIQAMAAADAVRVVAVSALYATAPVGGPGGQAQFLNAAARLETARAPLDLLDLLQDIETAHLRTREIRWGPRTLDLDILLYGDEEMATERLILPHPRLSERRFVLAPLADVAPDLVHPGLGASVSELLAKLDPADEGDVARIEDKWISA